MNKEYVWLSSSFFYNIKKWHLVLMEIEVFLEEVIKNEFVCFQVFLSYVPINSIRFSILCENEEIMDEIGSKFYKNFTEFKEKHRPKKYRVEVRGIGLLYPSDTFQLGLYSMRYSKKEHSVYKFQEHFSELIFSGLKTEEFTPEDTHTLAIYAIVTLGKVINNINQQITSSVFKKLQNDYFFNGFEIKDSFPEEFIEISNLTHHLLSIEDIKSEEPWLSDWFWFCKSDLQGNLENLTDSVEIESQLIQRYIDKSNLIANQLGIQQETKKTLLSLINFALVSNT